APALGGRVVAGVVPGVSGEQTSACGRQFGGGEDGRARRGMDWAERFGRCSCRPGGRAAHHALTHERGDASDSQHRSRSARGAASAGGAVAVGIPATARRGAGTHRCSRAGGLFCERGLDSDAQGELGCLAAQPGQHDGPAKLTLPEMNWLLLKNSLLVGGLTTLVAAGLGFLAALWLAGLEGRWRKCLLAVAIMALALPPFLVTNCWLDLLGYAGVWRGWLPLNIVSLGGTIWILSLLTWPITLLMVLSAWQRLEPSQLESDVAVRGWWLIRGLLWPLGRSALAQAGVLTFVLAMNNFAVPAILQVKVFPAEVWVRFNTAFDTLGALQLSWPLVVAPLLLLLWLARREFPWPRIEGAVSAKLFRQQLGPGWFWFCGACTTALCLLAVGLPVFQLVSVQRTWAELPGALAAGQSALWSSFSLAAVAATAVILLGLLISTR